MSRFYKIILVPVFLIVSSMSYGQLASGTYTIGGTTPNYASFNAAVSAMSSGVLGPVTFLVRGGTYTEQVSMPSITGASALSPIVFRPDPTNTTPVILTFSPTTSTSNYTVNFSGGASFITFKGITITTSGTSYTRVLSFNASDNITIDSCDIIGASNVGTTSTNYSVIYNYSGSTNMSNNATFSNNHISGGSYAIYWYGSSSSALEVNNTFINNIVDNYYIRGIHSYYQDNISLIGNEFMNDGTYSSASGIYAFGNSGVTFSHNTLNITGSSGVDGIYLSGSDGTPAIPNKVFNNFVIVTGGSASTYGIYSTGNTQMNIDHNSINLLGGSSSSSAIYVTGTTTDTIRVRNNNLASQISAVAFYIPSTSPVVQADYNNLYSTGTDLAYYTPNYYTTLTAFQTASSTNANSVSVNPGYYTNTNLHTTSIAINNSGTPISYITDDIDGDARSSTPDIGADEFTPLASDAGISRIDTPAAVTCASNIVYATIHNYGTGTLTGVTVNWGVNSTAQSPVTFSFNLPSGADTTVYLGSTSYSNGDVVYAYTVNPNGSAENPLGALNDTSTRIVNTGMSGIYTLGGPGADYYSYNSVVTDLLNRGVCGPVTISVNDSTYNEQVEIYPIPGASSTNTITFTSASGDSSQSILTFAPTSSAANYIVRLAGAEYVQFTKLSLISTGTTYGRVVEAQTGSNYNVFSNNIIRTTSTSTGTNTAVFYSSSSGSSRGNEILNNHIQGGYYGFYWYGNSATDRGKNLKVEGNTLYNQYYYATYFYYQDSLEFNRNKIYTGSNSNSITYGFRGSYISNFSIDGNDFNDSIGSYGYGIYLATSEGNLTDKAIIRNNMITKGDSLTGNYIYGIYLSSSGNIEVSHNSTNITSGAATATSIYVSGGGQIDVINNSFVLNNTGYGVYYSNSYSISRSDYNNIFVRNGGYVVVSDGWGYPTLGIWQNNTGFDPNSKNVDPNYHSRNDLHACNSNLDGTAQPGYASVDFDGQPRHITPDIGADEFLSNNFTLGPDTSFCAGSSVDIGFPSTYGSSFVWSTGETTSSITVSAPGTYTLITTGTCGGGTANIDVIQQSNPLPSFTYTNVNSYLTVVFTNTTPNGNTYLWDFGDGTTSTDVNPIHLFTTSGFHNVKLISTNECGTDSATIIINIQVVGLTETDFENLVSIYPNPTNGNFRVAMDGVEPGQYTLELLNLQGQVVYGEVVNSGTTYNHSVDVSGIAKGVYTLVLNGPSGKSVKKLIIQ